MSDKRAPDTLADETKKKLKVDDDDDDWATDSKPSNSNSAWAADTKPNNDWAADSKPKAWGGSGDILDEPMNDDSRDSFQSNSSSIASSVAESEPSSTPVAETLTRPDAPRLNPAHKNLIFQQLDLDFYLAPAHPVLSAVQENFTPVVRMFGLTSAGNSVCCLIHGFHPYFYVPAPLGFKEEDCGLFREELSRMVTSDQSKKREQVDRPVMSVEVMLKESIYGYHGKKKSLFLKITVALPHLVAPAKRILDRGFTCGRFTSRNYTSYEANVDFESRFMVDANVVGCNWIELPTSKYFVVRPQKKLSSCQYEIECSWRDIVSLPTEGEWGKIAPARILSFDIECAGRKGIFPEPQHDPVIQIANMVMYQGKSEPFIRNVFVLNTCSPIVGADVRSFETEEELLAAWADFVREVDPDILTGYNINNFDFPYLIDRAAKLKVNSFPFLGRIFKEKTLVKEKVFESKAYGKRVNKLINIEGRVQFDLLPILLRNYKLRSYSLNAVSYHFLLEQKEDVHHSIITDLQNGTEVTRRRLAVYCMKDALLPLRLLNKLMCLINYMEMARVTGRPKLNKNLLKFVLKVITSYQHC